LFSVLGVAREVCANYNLSLEMPTFEVASSINETINASVSNTQACPKYLTRVVKGIDNTVVTPQWMAKN
jgi:phenylalanyl-tRNA synthetase beta subunit (EC 6.1.1.20)